MEAWSFGFGFESLIRTERIDRIILVGDGMSILTPTYPCPSGETRGPEV